MSASTSSRSWRGVTAVAAWQVVASATYYAVFAATSSFRDTYGLSGFEVGLVVSVMTLGYTLLLFPMGAVVDAYGDHPAMVGGLVGLAIGAAGVAASGAGLPLAGTYPGLLVAVFVLGCAYATGMPATNRAVASRAPRGRYNLAVGLKQVGVTAGSAISAVFVTNHLVVPTWPASFAVIAAVGFLVAAAYALTFNGTGGSGRMEFPDIRAIAANRLLLVLSLAGFFLGAAIFTLTGYTVPYIEDATPATTAFAGATLALMQVSGSIGRIGAGSIADRIRGTAARASLRVLTVQVAAAAVLFFALPEAHGVWLLVVFAGLGFGLLGFTGLYHGAVTALAPEGKSGAATAAGQITLNIGGLVVPPLFGLVADTAGYTTGWYLLGLGVAASTAMVVFALVRYD